MDKKSLMEKYVRVKKPSTSPDEIGPNELRITSKGKAKNYITYALQRLQPKDGDDDEGSEAVGNNMVVLKAMGRAISKSVTIAEIIKRRVPGLHQLIEIASLELEDTYEPLKEGLEIVTSKRMVACISITLAVDASAVDITSPGYQAPNLMQ